MRYTNYPKQRYGYGEPQMTKREYEAMNKSDKRDWLGIFLAWFFGALLVCMTVVLVSGLDMRGLL